MVAAIAMVRDEADIIASTVGRMAAQVDMVIVADNLSVDGTRRVLEQLDRVQIIDDRESGYLQSEKMTRLAALAADQGAEWIVPFDADEVHLPAVGRRIADNLLELPDSVLVSEASLFDHVATAIDDTTIVDPVARMTWRRCQQVPLRKIACRWRPDLVIHQGNHSASYTGLDVVQHVTGRIEVRHFPYRSAEQMVRKALNGAAAYAATDLPETAGKHWRDYGRLVEKHGPEALHDVFRQWFFSESPATDPALVCDPCP